MATIKPLRVGVALLPCLLFAAAARTQQYTIKLQHAEKAGDTMPLDMDGKDVAATTTTIPGQALSTPTKHLAMIYLAHQKTD